MYQAYFLDLIVFIAFCSVKAFHKYVANNLLDQHLIKNKRWTNFKFKVFFEDSSERSLNVTLPHYASLANHLMTDDVPRHMIDQLSDTAKDTLMNAPPALLLAQNPKEISGSMLPPYPIFTAPALGNDRIISETDEGPAHFGDIMGGSQINTAQAELQLQFSALERILLTANGNLQRIISSFYNAPVTVQIIRNKRVGDWVYDREVKLIVHSKCFCKATSKVVLHSKECTEVIENGKVGIGQLFRHFNILPRFRLLTAGRTEGGFYRLYDLNSNHVSCRILEEFPNSVFSLSE